MSKLSIPTWHVAEPPTSEPVPPGVRSFLTESERKVFHHCRRLLALPDLSADHRRRLARLARDAENHLQRLVTT